MYYKFIFLFISLVMLPACQTKDNSKTYVNKSHTVEFGKINSMIPKKYAACHTPELCGSTAKIDCGADVDGELVYINNENGTILMHCGGACAPENRKPFGQECSKCPPKEWTCQ